MAAAGPADRSRHWLWAALLVVLTWAVHGSVAPHRGGHNLGPWPDSHEYAAGAQAIAQTGRYFLQLGELRVQPRYPPGTSIFQAAFVALGLPARAAYRVNAGLVAALALLLFGGTRWIAGRFGLLESRSGRRLTGAAAFASGIGFSTSALALERTFVDSDVLAALLATSALAATLAALLSTRPRRSASWFFAAGLCLGGTAAVRPVTALLLTPTLGVFLLGLWADRGLRLAFRGALAVSLGVAVPVLATCWLMWRSGWGALEWTGYRLWVPEFYGEGSRTFQLAFATAGNAHFPIPRLMGSGSAGHAEIAAAVYLGLPLVERHGLGWFWQLAAMLGAFCLAALAWRSRPQRRVLIACIGLGVTWWFIGHALLFSLYFYPDDRFHLAPAALLFPAFCAGGAVLLQRHRRFALCSWPPAAAMLLLGAWRAYDDIKSDPVQGVDASLAEVDREFLAWRQRPRELRWLAPIPFDTVAAQALGLLTSELVEELGELGQLTYAQRHAAHALAVGWVPDRDFQLPTPPGRPAARGPVGAGSNESGRLDLLWQERSARFVSGAPGGVSVEVDLQLLVATGELRLGTAPGDGSATGEPLLQARWLHREAAGADSAPLPLVATALRGFPGGLEVHFVRANPPADLVLRLRSVGASVSIELGGEVAGNAEWLWDLRFPGSAAREVVPGRTQGVLAATGSGWVSLLEDLGRSSARQQRSVSGEGPRSPRFGSAGGLDAQGFAEVQAHLWLTVHAERAMCLPKPAATPATALALASRTPLILAAQRLPRLPTLEGRLPWVLLPLPGNGAGARDPLQAQLLEAAPIAPLEGLAMLTSRLATAPEARFAVLAGSADSTLLQAAAQGADALWIEPASRSQGDVVLPADRPPRTLVAAFFDADGGLRLSAAELAGIVRGDLPAVLLDGSVPEAVLERRILELASFATPLVGRLARARAHGEPLRPSADEAAGPLRFEDGLELHANLSADPRVVRVGDAEYTLAPGGYLARDGDGFLAACVVGALGPQWFSEVPGRFRARRHHPEELPLFVPAQGAWQRLPAGASTGLEHIGLQAHTRWVLAAHGLQAELLPSAEVPQALHIQGPPVRQLTWQEPRSCLELRALALDGRSLPLPGDVLWSSADESVVSVDREGFLRGLAGGRSVVSASSASTGLTAEVAIEVDLVGPPRGLVATWASGRLQAEFEAPGALEAFLLIESLEQKSVLPAQRAAAPGKFFVSLDLPAAPPGYALRPCVHSQDGSPVLGEPLYLLTEEPAAAPATPPASTDGATRAAE
jgi:4-amino-4-deoxy-L-arabinose transferase-like glycosyltransferase